MSQPRPMATGRSRVGREILPCEGSFLQKLLIDWLEMEGNLESVMGAGWKTKVGAKHLTKKSAFQSLANHINENQLVSSEPPLETLQWDGARDRFLTLQEKYQQTRAKMGGTGWRPDKNDAEKKIYTLDAKENCLCPGFDRQEILFGESPAILTKENSYVSGTGASLEQMPVGPAEDGNFVELGDDEEARGKMGSSPFTASFENSTETLFEAKVRALEVKERIRKHQLNMKRGKKQHKMKSKRMQVIRAIIISDNHRSRSEIKELIASLPDVE